MGEEKERDVKRIDTKNIHSIAQYVVDGSLVMDAGDMFRLIILRTRPIINDGKMETVSFPVVELVISKDAAEHIKGNIEGWLSKKIEEKKE